MSGVAERFDQIKRIRIYPNIKRYVSGADA